MTTCAVLLAAGESSRMGTPKPLLEWFGAPLIRRQIEALLDAGVDEVYVVTGKRADEVEQAIPANDHVHAVRNSDFLVGKTTSVRAGLRVLPSNVSAIVLLAVDQPRPAWLIREVLQSHADSGALISSPEYGGHGGHPLVFDGSLRDEMQSITEEGEGVREVVRAHTDAMNRYRMDTPLARLDMNTREEVDAARELFPDPRTPIE